uniref:Uncharacterized protein n=1 Tax=Meloidogyne hapla TaxID=6305 RepID=A0A1I8BTF7_MELHA
MALIYPLNIQQKLLINLQQNNNYKNLEEYLINNNNILLEKQKHSFELNSQINSLPTFIPRTSNLIQQQQKILEFNENNIKKIFWEYLQNNKVNK